MTKRYEVIVVRSISRNQKCRVVVDADNQREASDLVREMAQSEGLDWEDLHELITNGTLSVIGANQIKEQAP